MNPLWIILGAVAVLAWLFRNGGGGPGGGTVLAVKGGTVDISNVEAVESRYLWEYSGPASRLTVQNGTRDNPAIDELPLAPAGLYTHKPLRPDPRNPQASKAGWKRILMDGWADGVEEGRWLQWWRPVVITVGDQLARGVRTVPDSMREDNTEVP